MTNTEAKVRRDSYGDTSLLVELFGGNYWNMHPGEFASVQVGNLRRAASTVEETRAAIASLTREVERLREYAQHKPLCGINLGNSNETAEEACTCGFAALSGKAQ